MAGSDASVGLDNNWWRNQAYGRQTSHGVGQILPEAGHLSSRSLSQALLTGPVWVPEPKQGLFSIGKGRVWIFEPSSILPLCSPGRHLTQRSKLGRDVRSEAIHWTHLTISSNVPSAICPNFASRFGD